MNTELRDHMWRFAQGVADPQAYAKSVLKEIGIDYDAEQARVNAQQQVECPRCAGAGGGVTRDGIEVDCGRCNGTGSVSE